MIQDGASAGSQDETTQGDIVFKLKYLKASITNALIFMAVFYGVNGVVFSNAESGIVGIIPYVSSVIIGVALSLIYVDRLWFTFKKNEFWAFWAAVVPAFILLMGMAVTGFSDIGYIKDYVLALSFLLNCQAISALRKKEMLQS